MQESHRGSTSRLSRQRIGSVTHLRIRGNIDETFSPQQASEELIGQVIIDLGRVERISSFGVRRWMEFVGRLPNGAVSLSIIHAPPIIVDQLNLVEGFAGIARVLSILAPYRCPNCREERVRLIDVEAEKATIAAGQAPRHDCAECRVPMNFAEAPGEFFDFVRNQQPCGVDPAVARFLRALNPVAAYTADEPSVAKLLVDDITYFRLAGTISADLNVRRLSAGLEGRVVFDLAPVARVDAAGWSRLLQVFEAVSSSAEVLLWRAPVPVLEAMALAGGTLAGKLSTVWIPSECRSCGQRSFERIGASEYLRVLDGETTITQECPVCGGPATQVLYRELRGALESIPKLPPPPELEAVEWRAFSQYLSTSSTGESNVSGEVSTSTGRLEVLRRIGQGGMAEVFLARQQGVKGFEKYVVMKKVLAQFAQSADFVEMLFSEARANARLTHPNIVQLFDVGMDQGNAYITMEYVRGPDLKKLISLMRRKGVRLPLEYALRIVAETAAGLHYAHSYVDPTGKPHPMVHRDVSPHNILVSLDGAIKLSDFGIAKMTGDSENTKAGVLKGKINYVSPEAVSGMRVDARSDVFALGVVLYELLTDRLPFRRETEAGTLAAIVRDTPPPPSQLNPAIPEDVSALVMSALEKDRERRMASAAQLREAVETALARHRKSASPSSVAQFFREQLGPELAEFDPSGTPSAPARPGSQPSLSAVSRPAPKPPPPVDDHSIDLPFTPVPQPLGAPEPPTVALRAPRLSREVPRPSPRTAAPAISPVTPTPSARPGRTIAAVVAGVGLLLAGAGVVMVRGPGAGTQVSNLGVEEKLYVQGVRVDPEALRLKGDALLVAVGRDGKLLRFGVATGGPTLNAGALVEVQPGSTEDEGATLELTTAQPGCAVKLDDNDLPILTPTRMTIPAGREVGIGVSCPGRPEWTRTLLAVPGQEIVLQVERDEG